MQKKLEAAQKMISYAIQDSFLVGRLRKDPGNGHRTRHRTKNDEEVSLPLRCARSWHKFQPPMLLQQPGNSFPNTGFGASNLRRQSRHWATDIGTITMLG